MFYDRTQKDDRIEPDEDEGPILNAAGGTPKRWCPRIVEPPICDEQEWHRF